MSRGFKDLRVWQRAHALADHVVSLTDSFPPTEVYALVPQLRRAARSVSHNIAEGASRRTAAEFLNFLFIARGSLAELEDQLLFARKRNYIPPSPDLDGGGRSGAANAQQVDLSAVCGRRPAALSIPVNRTVRSVVSCLFSVVCRRLLSGASSVARDTTPPLGKQRLDAAFSGRQQTTDNSQRRCHVTAF
jgi:four helix bundle protein